MLLGRSKSGDSKQLMEQMSNWDFSVKDVSAQSSEGKLYFSMQQFFEELQSHFEEVLSTSSQMKGVTQEIRDASENVREATEFIAQGAVGQAEGIEECRNVADGFADQIEDMNAQYRNMITLAEQMSDVNEKGKSMIENLSVQQQNNQKVLEDITGKINQIVEMSAKINEVTEVLYSIANQTNLLALNASIEAARAGEAGKGFAVVADEVRNLSVESREASQQINDSVNNMNEELQGLKKMVDQSQDTFTAQEKAVTTVVSVFKEIDNFTDQSISGQKSLMDDVSRLNHEKDSLKNTVGEMANTIEEATATTEEVASLTITQNSVVNLMDKMTDDMHGKVEKIQNQLKKIQIVKTAQVRKKVAMMFDLDIPFYKVTEKEAVKSAQVLGLDLKVFAPKSRNTCVDELCKELEKVIAENYDAIVISPVTDGRLEDLLKKAVSKGIKIVFLNSALSSVNYESLVTSDGIGLGASAAQAAKKTLNGVGKALICIWNDVHITAIEQREEGFIKEMQGSGIDVVKINVPCAPDASKAEQVMNSMFTQNPDADLVYTTNADWGILVAEYCSRHKKHIKLITIDYVKEMINYIRDGYIDYAIAQRNFVWGSMALEGIANVFDGKTMNRYNDTGSYEVTKNNYNIYQNRI